jgi:hypothetical protein
MENPLNTSIFLKQKITTKDTETPRYLRNYLLMLEGIAFVHLFNLVLGELGILGVFVVNI